MVSLSSGVTLSSCAASSYLELHEQDRQVAALDPLHADGLFATSLPALNRAAAIPELAQAIRDLLPAPEQLTALDRAGAMAATRDLGLLASSLATHAGGIQLVPALEETLLLLANVTREVPRDTLYSYCPRNPPGARTRMFLAIPEERLFIKSVTDSIYGFTPCIQVLEEALAAPALDEEIQKRLRLAAAELARMVDSILEVRRGISAEVFSFQMRPYFPPLELGGRSYGAPSGPQLPLIVVDILLFGAELAWADAAPQYAGYIADNLPYLPPALQSLALRARGRPSLAGRLRAEVLGQQRAPEATRHQLLGVAEAVLELMAVLLKFRWPHKKLAEDNMALRPPEARGSSGYTVDVLDMLLEQTLVAYADVKSIRHALRAA